MTFANETPPVLQPSRLYFEFLTPAQIRSLSVLSITEPVINDILGHPTRFGLYDPAMGPIDKSARCSTCHLGFFACPGHFGSIELPVPVYYPPLFGTMFQLLRLACTSCCRFRGGLLKTTLLSCKLRVLAEAEGAEALRALEALDLLMQSTAEEDEKTVSAEAIVKRLRQFTRTIIQDHPKPVSESEEKSAMVQLARKQLIMEWLKRQGPSSPGSSNRCSHCRSVIPSLVRSQNVKLFQTPSRGGRGAAAVAEVSITVNGDANGDEQEENGGSLSESSTTDSEANETAQGKAIAEAKQTKTDILAAKKTVISDESLITGRRYLSPVHAQDLLRRFWDNETALMSLVFGEGVTCDLFFMDVVPVPPNRFRPPAILGDQTFEHPQNTYLTQIIILGAKIRESQKKSATGDLLDAWLKLQEQVNYLCDSGRAPLGASGKVAPSGIKQLLERKEGLFRMHMMGKRVNYAARSVISPDPCLATSEIGVPMVFAKKLTYPETVTAFNLERLKHSVRNGPGKHPGATHLQMSDGGLLSLENTSDSAREALAARLTPGCIVHRQVRDGDVVLMNRQPSLHRPSMMAHRVRVLPGEKTLRMHYANCDAYNADFDGDEMNLHMHQSDNARAEAYVLAANYRHYLVPTDGSPLRGLIQDHIVTGVLLCLKDTWLTREQYQQLLCGCTPDQVNLRCDVGLGEELPTSSVIKTLPPAIMHPVPLWSGKQLVSTILHALNAPISVAAKGKVSTAVWGPGQTEEATLKIMDGYLLTGVLDKNQLGAAEEGLTHALHELYGPDVTSAWLTCMSRLLTKVDQMQGFTCRLDDLLLNPQAEDQRKRAFKDAEWRGRDVVAEYAGQSSTDAASLDSAMEQIVRHDELARGLDSAMKTAMNALTSGVIKSCLPEGLQRPFPHNHMALMTSTGAKGSIVNFSQISGCLGQQELEGRRVPPMASGRTLPSFAAWETRSRAGGYIAQRFLTGIRPQEFFFHCMAGREGLIDTAVKTSRSGYLQRCLVKHLESLRVAYDGTVRDQTDESLVQFLYGEDGLDVTRARCLTKFNWQSENAEAVLARCRPNEALERGTLDMETTRKYVRKALSKPEKYPPVTSEFWPTKYLGSCSEAFHKALEEYLAANPPHLLSEPQFRTLMWMRYMQALADPGEAVGLLAAQSIGEPSTQMTLNTFHFAGFGAKNVTLGIPRLREIIMTASTKIKTPTMSIQLLEEDEEKLEAIREGLTRVTLETLLRKVTVSERLKRIQGIRTRVYALEMQFESEAEDVSSSLKHAIENQFVTALMSAIEGKRLNRRKDLEDVIVSEKAAEDQAQPENEENEISKKNEHEESSSSDESEEEDETRRETSYGQDEEEEAGNADQKVTILEESVGVSCKRGSRMADNVHMFRSYSWKFPTVSLEVHLPIVQQRVLLLDLIHQIAPRVVIRQTPGIANASIVELEGVDKKHAIQTEGVNFKTIWEHPQADLIDLTHLHSNDIGAILQTFGVEAARAAIVREIGAVFGVYGISVDIRHLSLIADAMTSGGGFRPFNRQGMDHGTASPLLKMTFETTLSYLISSTLMRDWEELRGPSARIVMGMPVEQGSGAVHLCQDIA